MMQILEIVGGGIVMFAIIAFFWWVGLREQGFIKSMADRSRERAIQAREDLIMQQEAEKKRQR